MRAAAIASLLILGLSLFPISQAAAETDRPIFVAPTVGVRDFDSGRDLDSEVSFGARFGIDASTRFGLIMDYVYTSPARETTGSSANVSAIRGLARYRILSGSLRPYVLGGVGGVLFDFDDTFDTASLTLTLGGGAEYRLGARAFLFAEASADGYRARTVTYSSTGEEADSTERETEAIFAGTAGIAVEF